MGGRKGKGGERGGGHQVAHNDRYVDGTLSAAWKWSVALQDLHIQIRCAQSFQPLEVSLAWSGGTKCIQKVKSECRIYSQRKRDKKQTAEHGRSGSTLDYVGFRYLCMQVWHLPAAVVIILVNAAVVFMTSAGAHDELCKSIRLRVKPRSVCRRAYVHARAGMRREQRMDMLPYTWARRASGIGYAGYLSFCQAVCRGEVASFICKESSSSQDMQLFLPCCFIRGRRKSFRIRYSKKRESERERR